jgi:hypothetical protein
MEKRSSRCRNFSLFLEVIFQNFVGVKINRPKPMHGRRITAHEVPEPTVSNDKKKPLFSLEHAEIPNLRYPFDGFPVFRKKADGGISSRGSILLDHNFTLYDHT